MKDILTAIGRAFRILSFDTVKNGNINTTYKIDYSAPDKSYIFKN